MGTGNPFLEADCMLCECVSKKTAEKEDVGDAKNCDESCKTHVSSPWFVLMLSENLTKNKLLTSICK